MATHSSSCLENPRDGGAWWAAISGVAESQTRLKGLSSSSSIQHSDSVFLQIVLHYRLLQDNRYNYLCYTVYPCCLSILYVVLIVCILDVNLVPLICPPLFLPFGDYKVVFYICESVSVLQIYSFVLFF